MCLRVMDESSGDILRLTAEDTDRLWVWMSLHNKLPSLSSVPAIIKFFIMRPKQTAHGGTPLYSSIALEPV